MKLRATVNQKEVTFTQVEFPTEGSMNIRGLLNGSVHRFPVFKYEGTSLVHLITKGHVFQCDETLPIDTKYQTLAVHILEFIYEEASEHVETLEG